MKYNKKRKEHKNRGVTLFEVMIAIALFAIIVTPVMKSFVTSIRVNQKARRVMIATDLAQTLMEGYAGKSYEEVWKGMKRSVTPFVFDGTEVENEKLAFSSINNGFYNHGHSFNLGNQGFGPTGYIKNITNAGYELNMSAINTVAPGETEINKIISMPAIAALKARIAATTGDVVKPYDDTAAAGAFPFENADGSAIANDKLIYFGGSINDYTYAAATVGAEEIPKMCYMVYFRIQKDNYFYDAVVSFIPNAENAGEDALGNDWLKPGTTEKMDDEYFSYKIRVTVYEYKYEGKDPVTGVPYGYDISSGEWPSRFDGNVFDGVPVAIMESGIQYRRVENE